VGVLVVAVVEVAGADRGPALVDDPAETPESSCPPPGQRLSSQLMDTFTGIPPGPPGHFLIGNALQILREPFDFPIRCLHEYGDVVRLRLGRSLVYYLLSHPDHIEQVLRRDHRNFVKDKGTRMLSSFLGEGLLTSEGELWRRQRRLAQPTFQLDQIPKYGDVMVAYAERAAPLVIGQGEGAAEVIVIGSERAGGVLLRGGFEWCWGGYRHTGPTGNCDCFYRAPFADGIFFRSDIIRKLTLTGIKDGTSNTFMIGEDIPHLNCWSAWPYANDAISTCGIPPNINLDER